MATPAQIRAARSMLELSQPDLARLAGVSVSTLKRAEGKLKLAASGEAVSAIRSALENAGIEFIEENGGGPGVRLKKSENRDADDTGRA